MLASDNLMESRHLIVMRHAKAEAWAESDRDRTLAATGRADAASAGAWLAEQGLVVDHALISGAVRTRQTWEAMSAAAGWDCAATFDEGLYSADPETALDLIRAVPEQKRCLLVLGHNPTVALLAQMLDDGDGDPAATADMMMGYPTCALTVMRVPGGWADVDLAGASATAFHVGRA